MLTLMLVLVVYYPMGMGIPTYYLNNALNIYNQPYYTSNSI